MFYFSVFCEIILRIKLQFTTLSFRCDSFVFTAQDVPLVMLRYRYTVTSTIHRPKTKHGCISPAGGVKFGNKPKKYPNAHSNLGVD